MVSICRPPAILANNVMEHRRNALLLTARVKQERRSVARLLTFAATKSRRSRPIGLDYQYYFRARNYTYKRTGPVRRSGCFGATPADRLASSYRRSRLRATFTKHPGFSQAKAMSTIELSFASIDVSRYASS